MVGDQGLRSYLRSDPLQDLTQSSDRLVVYKEIEEIDFDEACDRYTIQTSEFSARLPSGPWDRAAISAVENVNKTFEYLYSTHSTQGTGSSNPQVTVQVGDDSECYRENASFGNNAMTIGVGGPSTTHWARSLDVIAHELGHGVTQSSSNLVYENEPGALNESFSDIIGVMVDRENWPIGDSIQRFGGFYRSMKNPAAGRPTRPYGSISRVTTPTITVAFTSTVGSPIGCFIC